MKPPVQQDRRPLRFNITPLIDVVFLLIIFFLVASHFVRNEQSHDVKLPQATKGQPDNEDIASRLTITIDKDGQMFIGGIPKTQAEVIAQLQKLSQETEKPQVRLRGHKDGTYGQMRMLIEQTAAANIKSIRFAVMPTE